MQKFTAACLAVMTLSALLLVGCSVGLSGGNGKHTGPVTVRNQWGNHFEFIRPNKEVFEMEFSPEYSGPQFKTGDVLGDLAYEDMKNHTSFFVKATLNKEHEEMPPTDATLYTNSTASYYCSGSQGCAINQGQAKGYYLWHDGAYRDKPEPKSKCKEK